MADRSKLVPKPLYSTPHVSHTWSNNEFAKDSRAIWNCGHFPFTKSFRKIPETSLGNAYRQKTCSIWHTRPIHPRLPSPSDVFPAKIENGGTTVIVEWMLDFSLEDEGLFNSDDDDIPFLAAVTTYMRRHLPRNKGFYENILLAYKLTIWWI